MNTSLPSPYSAPLTQTIERIWQLVIANTSGVGDRFERIIQSFYSQIVRDGDIVVDGGAHMGRHAIPLAQLVGESGQVLAFEPLPAVAGKLSTLLGASQLAGRVRLRPDALGRQAGRHSFFIVENMLEFSGLRRREFAGFVPQHAEIQVDVTTIDAAVPAGLRPGALSFVKLDLEGGEFRALQGAARVLRTHLPCCAFENGLSSSADDYGADEFFSFFAELDYALYDILGNPISRSLWSQPGPWYVMAIPNQHAHELTALLSACAMEEFLAEPWSPQQHQAPPTTFVTRAAGEDGSVIGAMDHLESVVRLKGWAVDARSGAPVRSLVITVDGAPVATLHPDQVRYDVVAALARVAYATSGFESAIPFAAVHRVAVHAEASDGGFVTIADSGPTTAR